MPLIGVFLKKIAPLKGQTKTRGGFRRRLHFARLICIAASLVSKGKGVLLQRNKSIKLKLRKTSKMMKEKKSSLTRKN